jgi:stage V sporulation protein SpoVS
MTKEKIEKVLFVSGTTNPKSLAKSIFASFTKEKLSTVKVRGIGAASVNQLCKGIIIAKSMLIQKDITLVFDIYFVDVKNIEKNNITAIEFSIDFV